MKSWGWSSGLEFGVGVGPVGRAEDSRSVLGTKKGSLWGLPF